MNFWPEMIPTDPNMFAMQWEVLFEVLSLVIIASFIVERVLAVLFESRMWVARHKKKPTPKSLIAVILSALICYFYQIDIMAVLMHHAHVSFLGVVTTGAVIAGGSKASIKLFRDILGVQSEASKQSKIGSK